MSKNISILIIAICWSSSVLAGEITGESQFNSVKESSNLNLEITPIEIETYTIYESKLFPGFRPCAPEDYRKKDNPIACEGEAAARLLSTREESQFLQELILEDDVIPQGNIYKLRFERFKRKKQ
jgi:hypothetical protein